MGALHVHLFGRFAVRYRQETVPGLEPRRAQELLAYLLLHNTRPHSREILANTMWPRSTTSQARKYLRHALWQVRSALGSSQTPEGEGLLSIDHEWLTVNPEADLWLDTRELERAYALVRGVPGREFDSRTAHVVQQALDLYRGDLLEGWYQEWCLFERERLQGLYLALLGKQIRYCEESGEYELGLECGVRALRCDVARERIHRRLMRLHYLSGNRSGALRQYEKCVAFLREELDTTPSARTVALYEQIRSDQPLASAPVDRNRESADAEKLLSPPETLQQLEQLQTAILELQSQLEETIATFQGVLADHD